MQAHLAALAALLAGCGALQRRADALLPNGGLAEELDDVEEQEPEQVTVVQQQPPPRDVEWEDARGSCEEADGAVEDCAYEEDAACFEDAAEHLPLPGAWASHACALQASVETSSEVTRACAAAAGAVMTASAASDNDFAEALRAAMPRACATAPAPNSLAGRQQVWCFCTIAATSDVSAEEEGC